MKTTEQQIADKVAAIAIIPHALEIELLTLGLKKSQPALDYRAEWNCPKCGRDYHTKWSVIGEPTCPRCHGEGDEQHLPVANWVRLSGLDVNDRDPISA